VRQQRPAASAGGSVRAADARGCAPAQRDDGIAFSYRRLADLLDAAERPPEAWQQLTAVVDTVGETIKQARARARAPGPRPCSARLRSGAALASAGAEARAAGKRWRRSARRWGT